MIEFVFNNIGTFLEKNSCMVMVAFAFAGALWYAQKAADREAKKYQEERKEIKETHQKELDRLQRQHEKHTGDLKHICDIDEDQQ